jgi:hypothetical protein
MTTTTTPAPRSISCAPESKNCFRSEQRTRRIRPAPQDPPYDDYVSTSSTTTTTLEPTVDPPFYLFDLISIPYSGDDVYCPSFGTTKPPMYFDAIGGDEKFSSGNMIFHKFFNDGIFYIQPYNEEIFEYATIEFLMVGGGGGGGSFNGGGGGGGGQVKKSIFNFPKGAYSIIIGQGGEASDIGGITSIPRLGLRAIGGGGGGTAFEDNATAGANGGGAGGRSNSPGGQAYGGYPGGSSSDFFGGGGGGGAGASGLHAPSIVGDIFYSAGKGGDGKAITFDNITYTYYGGGGAGDDFGDFMVDGSLGGGGSSFNRNGVDGTGGGGAGNGGVGGKGFVMIGYVPVTTPAPTTTTTLPPTPPSSLRDFVASGIFEGLQLSWTDPASIGTSPILSYTFKVYRGDVVDGILEDTITVEYTAPSMESDGFRIFDITGLDLETEYSVEAYATNSDGNSPSSFSTSITQTTTTLPNTPPPDFIAFIVDIDDDVDNGYVTTGGITIRGSEYSRREVTFEILASNEFFIPRDPKPTILLFGDGSSDFIVDEFEFFYSPDQSSVTAKLPFIMPNRPETRVTIYVNAVGEPSEGTTTTTSTSTTTLAPFCTELYHSVEPSSSDTYSHPDDTQRLLNPVQFFLFEDNIPTEIAGATTPSSIISGRPWYNGKYFEISRAESEADFYVASLPNGHNNLLVVSENEDGSQNLLPSSFYKLVYPIPDRSRTSINYDSKDNIFVEGSHVIYLITKLDYLCTIENKNEYGLGDETLDGFTSIKIVESFDGEETVLESKLINGKDFRATGSFNSNLTGQSFYYMLDFGTRENIVGK